MLLAITSTIVCPLPHIKIARGLGVGTRITGFWCTWVPAREGLMGMGVGISGYGYYYLI